MKYLTPRLIAEVTGGEYVGAASALDSRVGGAARDNRDVRPGCLFVCIRGKRADGHDFAADAFGAGAACCLVERPLTGEAGPYVLVGSTLDAIKLIGARYRQMLDIPIIGITGSVGKTTAKEMAAAVLGSRFNVLKTPDNLNNELGVPLTLLSITEAHEVAVIEMGISDFHEMGRLAGMVRPNMQIITKIGHAHLKELGDLSGVLRAKAEVFEFMDAGGTAILNGDDDLLWGYDPGIRKVTYGLDGRNDFRAEKIRAEGTDSIFCEILGGAHSVNARIPAYGRHLVMAALAATAVGSLLGLNAEEISRGMLSYAPVGGRANVSASGCITLIDDSYNANPDSVRAALESLCGLDGRRVAVLGDMLALGALSDEMHREIGVFAARAGIDLLVCCGENAAFIHEGYISAGGKSARYFCTKGQLLEVLHGLLHKGDSVLVKASNGMGFREIAHALCGEQMQN